MKERALSYGHNQRGEFVRLKRKIKTIQRQNMTPPQEMLERLVELDGWFTNNYEGWVSNFPRTQGNMNGGNK